MPDRLTIFSALKYKASKPCPPAHSHDYNFRSNLPPPHRTILSRLPETASPATRASAPAFTDPIFRPPLKPFEKNGFSLGQTPIKCQLLRLVFANGLNLLLRIGGPHQEPAKFSRSAN